MIQLADATPEVGIEALDTDIIFPSKTYEIDFENNKLTGRMIDGLEALRQFVVLALRTSRFSYESYSADFGSELADLIADKEATDALIEMEIPRLIEEALIYDERVESVSDFVIEKKDDSYAVSFTVNSSEGVLNIQEVIN
ncbi:DUF2634 domain-containing protein [Listeria booriae]|nr:DUF2634 domain-containing protein [Listeria booriae]